MIAVLVGAPLPRKASLLQQLAHQQLIVLGSLIGPAWRPCVRVFLAYCP